jgi:hypothetical protein
MSYLDSWLSLLPQVIAPSIYRRARNPSITFAESLPIGNRIVTFETIDIKALSLCFVVETKEAHPPPSGTQRQIRRH